MVIPVIASVGGSILPIVSRIGVSSAATWIGRGMAFMTGQQIVKKYAKKNRSAGKKRKAKKAKKVKRTRSRKHGRR